MALIKIKDSITKKEFSYYMDNRLKRQLDIKVKSALIKKDEDYVIVIDGEERSGKSTLGFQIGKYLDPTLNVAGVCFDPNEFRKAVLEAQKGQCIIFDEAYRGLSAKGALTEVNRILVSLMMEMGQKNLIVIIILPTFYLLEKYVALWRARGLFHVFRKRGNKGYWTFFNRKKKQTLYLKGKRDYGYYYVKSSFKGRFYGKCVIDEIKYRKKKALSLRKGYKTTRQEKYKEQRDKLIYALQKETGLKLDDMFKISKMYQIGLKRTMLHLILEKFKN